MLIDLHCHTLPLSQCSSLQPEELVDLARESGLDGVCLSEHDALWDADALDALGQRTGFLVLRGIELTTDYGHVLAYGITNGSALLGSFAEVSRVARCQHALLYLAHPARDGLLRLPENASAHFASVETVNGSDSALQNASAAGLAPGFRLPGIGGSDAHTPAEVGGAATEFEAEITDEQSLLIALRSGKYTAVTRS